MDLHASPRTLTICGSAAAEGFPGLHCACDTCREAWRRGGKDLRTRTAYDLGPDVRVDFGPDAYLHALRAGRDYTGLRHLLITHDHWDHWCPEEVSFRSAGFCRLPNAPALRVYGTRESLDHLTRVVGSLDNVRVEVTEARPGEPLRLDDGLEVLPLAAAHKGGDALNYVIVDHGASTLIANDTGWWDDATWGLIAGRRLDVAVIDCTYGRYDQHGGHMGAPVVVRFAERLRELGCLHEASRVVANHFSHNGHALHEDLEAILSPAGIEVGYDGMTVEPGGCSAHGGK
jgi:phosphoribosyl 1,2-cyclic phosphate phosphodiesterase